MSRTKKHASIERSGPAAGYDDFLLDVSGLIDEARRSAARAVNSVMTATYWLVGRRIVEHEQAGARRAQYGESVLERLSADLGARFGRGFSVDRLELMRLFYLTYQAGDISATTSRKSMPRKSATLSRKSGLGLATVSFPLPWSHYIALLRRVRSAEAREFYETEALRGGWTSRQLERQIDSRFYERTALSRNKAAMMRKGGHARLEDAVTPDEEVKDPLFLEFLGLKDEYSESQLEEALVRKLEEFMQDPPYPGATPKLMTIPQAEALSK